jgi:hypothetical protein
LAWCVAQKDNNEEEIRLKILQTLPLLVTPTAYVLTPMFIAQAFEVCFHLLGDKSAVIQHTAEATVRQVGGRLPHDGVTSTSHAVGRTVALGALSSG